MHNKCVWCDENILYHSNQKAFWHGFMYGFTLPITFVIDPFKKGSIKIKKSIRSIYYIFKEF